MTAGVQNITIDADRGVGEEDHLASPVFAVSLVDPVKMPHQEVQAQDQEVSIIQVAEDITICTSPGLILQKR